MARHSCRTGRRYPRRDLPAPTTSRSPPVPTPPVVQRLTLPALGAVLAGIARAGCADKVSSTGKTEADRVTTPELGTCHALDPEDVAKASDASKPVSCSGDH